MSSYRYFNIRNDGKHLPDCVCRAISLGLDLDYKEVERKLWYTSELFDCPMLCVCCYHNLIELVYGCERVDCRGMSVGEFAYYHPQGIFIIRVPNHLTTVIDGVINDIWDCSDEPCDIAWVVE